MALFPHIQPSKSDHQSCDEKIFHWMLIQIEGEDITNFYRLNSSHLLLNYILIFFYDKKVFFFLYLVVIQRLLPLLS